MSFVFYLSAGFCSGLLGGMGMGGGTILIPALTIIFGVEQHAAQAANLIAFLPMALLTLNVHKKNGLLKTEGLSPVVISALLTSVAAGFTAAFLPSVVLKRLFGGFLIALSVKLLLHTVSSSKRAS